jgi:hypothetical protein
MNPQIGVSSWSLHRTLGRSQFDAVAGQNGRALEDGALSLLDLPAKLNEFGLNRLEICHFHLPSIEAEYLRSLRGALDKSGVELWSLLIDSGDITHPESGAHDAEYTAQWIDVAGELGARHARVIAGKAQPTPETLALSRDRLKVLCARAKARGVRVLTENWFDLLGQPEDVLWLLDALESEMGLNLDFGNWSGESKYFDLAQIAPRAESCHAKCAFFGPQQFDRDDFLACLDIARAGGFEGTYTLIYDGPDDDEWAHLQIEREIVADYL